LLSGVCYTGSVCYAGSVCYGGSVYEQNSKPCLLGGSVHNYAYALDCYPSYPSHMEIGIEVAQWFVQPQLQSESL